MSPTDVFVVTFGAGMVLFCLGWIVLAAYVAARDWLLGIEGEHGCRRGRHLWSTVALYGHNGGPGVVGPGMTRERCTRCGQERLLDVRVMT